MQHYVFLIINIAVLLVIYYVDRKNIKTHLWLGIIAFFGAIAFEIIPLLMGFWTHYSQPKIWIFSVYSFILYFPFISISYFLGKKLFRLE